MPLAEQVFRMDIIISMLRPSREISVQTSRSDFFILRRPGTDSGFDWAGLGVWLAGFVIYRLLMNVDFVLGNTLPDMLITMALCVLVRRLLPGSGRRAS